MPSHTTFRLHGDSRQDHATRERQHNLQPNHRSTMGLGNASELGQLSDEMLTADGRLASHFPSFLACGEW